MRFATSVLAAAALALACGGAFAADDSTKEKENQAHRGFNEMDKNADGKLTREEAAGNKDLLKRWKNADKNNDGYLTRAEYLQEMAKKDANTVKEKVTKAPDAVKREANEAERRAPGASSGSTSEAKPK
jgi:Ca2+-binding EF-hand superfamily protein